MQRNFFFKSVYKFYWKITLCLLLLLSRQTDDKGVFCTDLSQEYQLAASTFGLTQEAMWSLSQQAIGYTFAPEPIKEKLEKKWAELKQQILQ